jgi:hypothetical protein
MKIIPLVLGLMLLAGGCASAGSDRRSEPARAEQSMKSYSQDFSSSPQYLEQRAKQRQLNPYL